jgi:FkbM family methyltransferase
MFVRVPGDAQVLRQRPYPRTLNVLDRKKTAVQRQLRRGGLASYEPDTQATLLALVEVAPAPVEFFDIGAHIGLYSTLISVIFGDDKVRVRAFEPTPKTAGIARRMAEANGAPVQVNELALASESGFATLYVSAKAETSNSLAEGFREALDEIKVEVTTLDAYCAAHEVTPNVVKIDVETFEAQVLMGGLETFKTARPAVVIELLGSDRLDESITALRQLARFGYVAYRLTDKGTWKRTALSDIPARVNNRSRDWLLFPGRLPAGLAKAKKRWMQAIAECTEETNVFTRGGEPWPEGWNDPYDAPAAATRARRGRRWRMSWRVASRAS